MNRHALELELRRLRDRYDTQPDGRIFAPLADCLRKLGNFDEAADICRRGLEIHGDYVSGWVVFGKILVDRGEHEEAAESFARVLELDPENLVAMAQLARWAEIRGASEEALELLRRIMALDPGNEDALQRIEALQAQSSEADSAQEASEPAPSVPEASEAADLLKEGPSVGGESPAVADPEIFGAAEPPSQEDTVRDVDRPQPVPVGVGGAEAPGLGSAPPLPDVQEDADLRERLREQLPPTEIATITLAEIYYEQGFKGRALDVYRQVAQRNPAIPGVRERIEVLNRELGARAAEAETSTVARDEVPGKAGGEAISGAHPSAPLRSPSEEALDEEREQARFDHFRNWLERIKVNDP